MQISAGTTGDQSPGCSSDQASQLTDGFKSRTPQNRQHRHPECLRSPHSLEKNFSFRSLLTVSSAAGRPGELGGAAEGLELGSSSPIDCFLIYLWDYVVGLAYYYSSVVTGYAKKSCYSS